MPTGVYDRSLVRSRCRDGKELVDLTEASKILCLSITSVHWQIKKKGVLKLVEYSSRRWWVWKSDVLVLKVRREQEANESIEVARAHQLRAQKDWHHRMTIEGRCHWCGALASKEFKNACDKHIEAARAINRNSKKRIKANSKAKGLCASCNKRGNKKFK